MASRAPPAPSATSGYSVVSYPAEYIYSPGGYPAHPHGMPAVSSMPVMECSAMPTSPPGYPTHYATGIAYAHMSQLGQAPPSPMLAHAHAPSSPHHAPSSPDRSSADTKVMRQILTAMTKMQSTMKELAERQEQALDRMSLLEQRVGRIDDTVERILENSEILLEEAKNIRSQSDDTDGLEAFESRVTGMMESVANRLLDGLGDEVRDINRMVKDIKFDPLAYQRFHDAEILGEEEQREVGEV